MKNCSDIDSIEIVPFSREIEKTDFVSGNSVLDDWLIRYAGQNEDNFRTRTFFAISGAQELLGYYTSVFRELSTDEQVGAMPTTRYSKSVFLIARLAVDVRYQGCGVGRSLLKDALSKAMEVSEAAGLELVVVEAKDSSAVEFYSQFGFIRFDEGSNKMFTSVRRLSRSK